MPCINRPLLLLRTLWKLREGPKIFAKIRFARYVNLIVQIAKVTHTQNVLVHKNSDRGMSQEKYTACTSTCMSKEPDVRLPSPPPFPPPFPSLWRQEPSTDWYVWGFGVVFHNQSDHDTSLCHISGSMWLNKSSQSYALCSMIPNSILGNRWDQIIQILGRHFCRERLLLYIWCFRKISLKVFSITKPGGLIGCYTTLGMWAVNREWSSFAESQITTRILTWWLCDWILARVQDSRNAVLIFPISIIGLAIRAKTNVKIN